MLLARMGAICPNSIMSQFCLRGSLESALQASLTSLNLLLASSFPSLFLGWYCRANLRQAFLMSSRLEFLGIPRISQQFLFLLGQCLLKNSFSDSSSKPCSSQKRSNILSASSLPYSLWFISSQWALLFWLDSTSQASEMPVNLLSASFLLVLFLSGCHWLDSFLQASSISLALASVLTPRISQQSLLVLRGGCDCFCIVILIRYTQLSSHFKNVAPMAVISPSANREGHRVQSLKINWIAFFIDQPFCKFALNDYCFGSIIEFGLRQIISNQIVIVMNGLHITGMKLSSPGPAKKTVPAAQVKPKQAPVAPVNKSTARKPVVPMTKQKTPASTKKEAAEKVPPVQTKKEEEKVVVKPISQPQQKEQKKQQPKVEEKKEEVPPVVFEVVARYNHYKDKFPCTNGVLKFALPNEKYCFGLVFKGNYQPVLRNFKSRDILEPLTTGKADEFSWQVAENEVYEIQIQEDEEEESKYERHVYRAPEKPKACPMKKNQRAEELTQQMKDMGVEELGTEKHRQLLEQRDLEDILFS